MISLLKKLPLWDVLAGNPVFLRVVEAAGCRGRQAALRCVYLLVLLAIMFFSSLAGMGAGSLNDLSQMSAQVFMIISFIQLAVVAVAAPIFTAGAITQEKDNETFRVLLCTPLTNAQIVYGMLLSRLFMLLTLLLSGLPIFLITQHFGGVTGASILLSFAIAAATATFTGALAISLAVFTVGSRRMVFNFYVFYGLYLLVVGVLGVSPLFELKYAGVTTSWLTAAHPMLALSAALHTTVAPDPAMVAGKSWLVRQWLCYPQLVYVVWTFAISLILPATAAVLLRWRQANIKRRTKFKWRFWRRESHAPRTVWKNPVAWREAATRCSTGGGGIVKWAFFIVGAFLAVLQLLMYIRGVVSPDDQRAAMSLLLSCEFGLIMLIVCWFSATAINREIEDGTMELLVMSPVTSRDYIYGKLRGLLSLTAVLMIVPIATALMQGVYDLFGPSTAVTFGRMGRTLDVAVMPLEAAVIIAMVLPVCCAQVALIGLSFSLKESGTYKAMAKTIVTVGSIFGCLGLFMAIASSTETPMAALAATANPFILAWALTMPHQMLESVMASASSYGSFRVMFFAAAIISTIIYIVATWLFMRQLENTFDMSIRKRRKG